VVVHALSDSVLFVAGAVQGQHLLGADIAGGMAGASGGGGAAAKPTALVVPLVSGTL
jgi:hypothetical protein